MFIIKFTCFICSLNRCWWGYNFTSIYYILEGPRLAVLLLNFIFLLNIIRVLVVKLRQSHTSDIEQARKAVRAAIVLIPLLGITNILNMTEAPLHRTAFEFALWSYTTHFLTSFQGLFIATIYCFMNNEASLLTKCSSHHFNAYQKSTIVREKNEMKENKSSIKTIQLHSLFYILSHSHRLIDGNKTKKTGSIFIFLSFI